MIQNIVFSSNTSISVVVSLYDQNFWNVTKVLLYMWCGPSNNVLTPTSTSPPPIYLNKKKTTTTTNQLTQNLFFFVASDFQKKKHYQETKIANMMI